LQVNVHPIIDPCAIADLNNDEVVDGADRSVIYSNWGMSMPGGPGNLNGDEVVDGADIAVVYECWTGDAAHSAAVPEPNLAGLLVGCLVGLTARNRKI